jgi:hypothetical protein
MYWLNIHAVTPHGEIEGWIEGKQLKVLSVDGKVVKLNALPLSRLENLSLDELNILKQFYMSFSWGCFITIVLSALIYFMVWLITNRPFGWEAIITLIITFGLIGVMLDNMSKMDLNLLNQIIKERQAETPK